MSSMSSNGRSGKDKKVRRGKISIYLDSKTAKVTGDVFVRHLVARTGYTRGQVRAMIWLEGIRAVNLMLQRAEAERAKQDKGEQEVPQEAPTEGAEGGVDGSTSSNT